ncbi:MAG: hypothetical protein A2X61_14760 [Ignavibacteria bacterium GWB2_35_12]|nr:MAG: hypothetical protein A2X63_06690 [Ignavibacteria bacterium GWA2_35_8]OGU38342.1 MAG: hypothetical protein A2X61_14760 [Ignavibacteria bacterium GWB2_35_12]OGU94210.1 MAG: hypothetical protein A2220_01755 [Ignavibacteria bacterium RIFOXYA2_FULL_35_10]OGV23422.1 MAG: hypothetical protein A2475_06495 [Ignavibacteria bacterium RIFOXYC2_FULL_35_21]
MKNQHKKKVPDNFMRKEYDFDYSTGTRGKYARKATEKNGYVKLTDDVHKYFKTSEDVNNALRAVIEAFPKARQRAV